VQISYYETQNLNPLSKIFVSVNFIEEESKRTSYNEDSFVVKRDVFGEYKRFDKQEMEFFDRNSFSIPKKVSKEINQEIEEWF